MNALPKTLLTVYLLVLLWLVLFKLSIDPASVIANYHVRTINLMPFAGSTSGSLLEPVYNVLVFIPLGVLLGVNCSRVGFKRILLFVILLSTSVEITQYLLSIGRTDITDILTNTVGGYLGLAIYNFLQKYIDKEKLNRLIVIMGTLLIVLFLLLRFFLLRVRYQSH